MIEYPESVLRVLRRFRNVPDDPKVNADLPWAYQLTLYDVYRQQAALHYTCTKAFLPIRCVHDICNGLMTGALKEIWEPIQRELAFHVQD